MDLERTATGEARAPGFQLTLIPYTGIAFQICQWKALEQLSGKILAIDWGDARNSLETLLNEVLDLLSDIEILLGSREASKAEKARAMRLHINIPDADERITRSEHYFPIRGTAADFHIREAYNLLRERSVLKHGEEPGRPYSFCGAWQSLEGGQLVSYPDFPFGDRLRQLGVPEAEGDGAGRLLYELARGEQVLVHLPAHHGASPLLLAVAPEIKGFRCSDLSGNPVPVESPPQNSRRKYAAAKAKKKNG